MLTRTEYTDALLPLVDMAVRSPGLLPPNEFNLARYSLNPHTRNRLLDPDIGALEDYFVDNSGLPGGAASNLALLHAFGDVVAQLCQDINMPLQIGYQQMAWLLAWLNMRHLPSFFGEDPDSPLQILQMAAALGYGEWAAIFSQYGEGLDVLFELGNSPLWRVRDAAGLGVTRLLRHDWVATIRQLRRRALQANAAEWRLIVFALRQETALLRDERSAQVVDALAMQQDALRFVRDLDARRREQDAAQQLSQALAESITAVLRAWPALGFAQVHAWALWTEPEVKAILRESLQNLNGWPDEAAQIWLLLR